MPSINLNSDYTTDSKHFYQKLGHGYMLATAKFVYKLEIFKNIFWKKMRLFKRLFKTHWTNTLLVCTNLNAIFMIDSNAATDYKYGHFWKLFHLSSEFDKCFTCQHKFKYQYKKVKIWIFGQFKGLIKNHLTIQDFYLNAVFRLNGNMEITNWIF